MANGEINFFDLSITVSKVFAPFLDRFWLVKRRTWRKLDFTLKTHFVFGVFTCWHITPRDALFFRVYGQPHERLCPIPVSVLFHVGSVEKNTREGKDGYRTRLAGSRVQPLRPLAHLKTHILHVPCTQGIWCRLPLVLKCTRSFPVSSPLTIAAFEMFANPLLSDREKGRVRWCELGCRIDLFESNHIRSQRTERFVISKTIDVHCSPWHCIMCYDQG